MQKETGLADKYNIIANFHPAIWSTVYLDRVYTPTLQDLSARVMLGCRQVVLDYEQVPCPSVVLSAIMGQVSINA